MAMICDAPDMRAPWIAASPTPPQPMTATVEPASTFAEFTTAPTPVTTPQPMSAATSIGTDDSSRTTDASGAIVSSPNAAGPRPGLMCSPPALAYGVNMWVNPDSHNVGWPRTQKKHRRHGAIGAMIT